MPRPTEDKWEPIESLGTTGETVARNVKALRGRVPYTELAARLKDLGRDIPTWGLRKIESGGRRVDVDDLIALARALDVSPVRLMMPVTDEPDDECAITTESKPVPAYSIWGWLRGDSPLDYRSGDDLNYPWIFQGHSRPRWAPAVGIGQMRPTNGVGMDELNRAAMEAVDRALRDRGITHGDD